MLNTLFALTLLVVFTACQSSTPTDATGLPIADSTGIQQGDTLRVGKVDGELGEGGNCVWVEPYHRTDGTCVRGHWKSTPGKKCGWVGTLYKECP